MNISLEEFVLESGFYSEDTISLFLDAMEHRSDRDSMRLIDRLSFDKQMYETYDVAPYEEKEDITAFLPEKY